MVAIRAPFEPEAGAYAAGHHSPGAADRRLQLLAGAGMGGSLARLAADLALLDASALGILPGLDPITLPAAFALAARGFGVPADAALAAYVWSWLENQALAAVKLVPLGQVAGQRILAALGAKIPAALATATADDDIATFAPGFALACARHETQYTRLFRS